jgi:putative OPT family oligopeptide transporter
LSAPQAALISAIAQGVLGGGLDWGLIGIGAVIGAIVIAVDEMLRRTGRGALPPLAVGMGIYLPMQVTSMVVVGAVLGYFYNRWAARQANPEFAERMGVLTATGLIVGDGLFNIAYAAIVGATNNPDVLAVVSTSSATVPLGILVFAGIVVYAYRRMIRDGAEPVTPTP